MPDAKPQSDQSDRIWRFFASVKLSVVLLIVLALTSILGTFIPQNQDPALYAANYGEILYKILSGLNLFDMYHSRWFQFLILMLAINIIVCSLDRLGAVWKIVTLKKPPFNLERFRKNAAKAEFSMDQAPLEIKNAFEGYISKRFGYHRTEDHQEGFVLLAEKGRWTRLGAYGVHFSILLLLVGGLVGSIFGFDGYVNIAENQSTDTIWLRNVNQPHKLDFQIHCDDFDVSFYESGAPKEFRSSLRLVRNGKVLVKKDIIVNDPLRFEGISIFQSSYGMMAPEQVNFNITSKASGMVYPLSMKAGETRELPEGLGRFTFESYQGGFLFRGHDLGPVFLGRHTSAAGESEDIVIPIKFGNFDKMRGGDFIVSVANYQKRYYTGLQVNQDPGVWIVYTAFILMIIGFYITFFMSHQRICIEIRRETGATRVMVAGSANRNKLGMNLRVEKLASRLQALGERI